MDAFTFDPTLYRGRPADPAGRSARELGCYDLLERLQIEYCRVDHAPADTIADCTHIDSLLGVSMCKNLFLCNRQQTNFYLLLMPGDKAFHTKDLSKQIGAARLSFADAAHMTAYLGVTPGSVTVMGLALDTGRHVRLLIDRDVLRAPYVGCHPMVNTASIRIATAALIDVFLPHTGHAPELVTL